MNHGMDTITGLIQRKRTTVEQFPAAQSFCLQSNMIKKYYESPENSLHLFLNTCVLHMEDARLCWSWISDYNL